MQKIVCNEFLASSGRRILGCFSIAASVICSYYLISWSMEVLVLVLDRSSSSALQRPSSKVSSNLCSLLSSFFNVNYRYVFLVEGCRPSVLIYFSFACRKNFFLVFSLSPVQTSPVRAGSVIFWATSKVVQDQVSLSSDESSSLSCVEGTGIMSASSLRSIRSYSFCSKLSPPRQFGILTASFCTPSSISISKIPVVKNS